MVCNNDKVSMKANTRAGINVTHRCNCSCKHCFYRWNNEAKGNYDRTLSEVVSEAAAGKAKNCDHVVLIGWGEPGLWPFILDAIKEFTRMGMTSSIITNGTLPVKRYAEMREAGLNHLHISVHHGFNPDEIMGQQGAGKRQQELFEWLKKDQWPWRSNMSIQKANCDAIVGTAMKCISYGCKHFVSLGFLPHYQWQDDFDRARTVVADPAENSLGIADLADCFERGAADGAMLSIRYHPMCLLPKSAWRHVCNAKYVVVDPGEWSYDSSNLSGDALIAKMNEIGGAVAIQSEPCSGCDLKIHCGAYNRTMFAMYPNMGLHAIKDPEIKQEVGWLFEQNPFSRWKGWF
jgi:hypothetical protein